jgi:hypothetical protein
MSGSCLPRKPWALIVILVLAAGCQGYNFNPVGHCIYQPGRTTETLSNISTADVLFVVDDSGSMEAEQAKLAAGFDLFIQNLDLTNAQRATLDQQPIDFHIAITTTSVYYNPWDVQEPSTCKTNCWDAPGASVCCRDATDRAVRTPRTCTPGVTACTTGTSCRIDCTGLKGEYHCCYPDLSIPPAEVALGDVVPCTRVGTDSAPVRCGVLERNYFIASSSSCVRGIGVDGWPFPEGDFVSSTDTGVNPRVLHFDKQLYPEAQTCGGTGDPACASDEACVASYTGAQTVCRKSCATAACATGFKCVGQACQPTNRQGFTAADLVAAFKENVVVGTCGSGQEQALEAARLAIDRALTGEQKDTYNIPVGGGDATLSWDASLRVAGWPSEWLHDNSKLVVVFVGDEDDCSSPVDASDGVVLLNWEGPGQDACVDDDDCSVSGAAVCHKKYPVASFADYFMGLGRPLGAAFIESATGTGPDGASKCGYGTHGTCSPGLCCQPDCPSAGLCGSGGGSCGGQAPGNRFIATATELKARGVPEEDVLVGSVCDPSFNTLLDEIARIVKPPTGLPLPSLPAEDDITVLRIAAGDETRKICGRPAPASLTAAEAIAQGWDWWFTTELNPADPDPSEVSQSIYINPAGACIANPGETYSVEYIGQMPVGGCRSDLDCRTALGGSDESWTCYAGVDELGACIDAGTSPSAGTCICGARSHNCPP